MLVVGKTVDKHLDALIADYVARIGHFRPFSLEVIPELKATKALTLLQQKEREGKLILDKLQAGDHVVLLDEHGREWRSVDWAAKLEKTFSQSMRRVVFIIGGPYGFSDEVYAKATEKLSLSAMTFSHQMIRLLFVEQFYRAMTITAGIPYHHE